jgi:hypothetical protein
MTIERVHIYIKEKIRRSKREICVYHKRGEKLKNQRRRSILDSEVIIYSKEILPV